MTTAVAELAGGTYQSLDEGKIEQASHVIAHDSQCDAYARATEAHKLRTAAFWLWECVHFQNVFDLSDEVICASEACLEFSWLTAAGNADI